MLLTRKNLALCLRVLACLPLIVLLALVLPLAAIESRYGRVQQ